MKNILKLLCVFGILFVVVSCEEDLDRLNTNTVDPTEIDEVFLLNNAIIETSLPISQLVYEMGIIQQIISPNSGVLTGANFNQDNRNVTLQIWNNHYQDLIQVTGLIKGSLADNPDRSNLFQMNEIIEAHAFMVLTDTYGDVPYFEAGLGRGENIVLPAYDDQAQIYPDLISRVTAATTALDPNGDTYPGEILYGGDISQWQKLGNSLLVRLGMRLSQADPALAEQTVAAAFGRGILESNDDNFVIRHDGNYVNDLGRLLNATEASNFYLAAPFVNFLADNNDPRLGSIAVRYTGAESGADQVPEVENTNPADQIGMPLGFDNGTIVGVADDLGLSSFYEFSQADRNRIANTFTPFFVLTHAQTQLFLAEAAERGWIAGDPATFYNEGVRAHMEQMALYDPSIAIPDAEIDAYLLANPFDAGNALEQINTQYWVACFLNGPEAFANFRRSEFPTLTPNPFPGQDISTDFINRLTYPLDELAVNGANAEVAIGRQGPDNLETRVWWDQ